MVDEWHDTTLGQVTDFLSGGTPSKEAPQYWCGSIPWVSAKDMKRFRLDDTEDHVTEDGLANGTKLVPSGTVLVLARGMTLLNDLPICVVNRPMTFNQDVKALRPKPGVLDEFLPYLLLGNKDRLLNLVDLAGHGTGRLNSDELKALEVVLPPEPEQRAIAHILGTLDDKIELNRRINETLEAMAQALFKSWFVEFDPVRAKAEGREPGLPPPLADLFPDSFLDSELGEIPKGWEVGKLGDFLEQRVERCVASVETAARPYVPIDCISSKSLFLTVSKPGEEAQSSLIKFYKGDLLFGAMRPYFHKVCIAPFDGTTRSTAFVLHPKKNNDFAFTTLLLHHPETIDYATRHSTGSTIPYALWTGSLEAMPAIVPPSDIRKAFDQVVRPMLTRIPEPYFQNRTLDIMRDTLLPKLISGELRIRDTERIIGIQG